MSADTATLIERLRRDEELFAGAPLADTAADCRAALEGLQLALDQAQAERDEALEGRREARVHAAYFKHTVLRMPDPLPWEAH